MDHQGSETGEARRRVRGLNQEVGAGLLLLGLAGIGLAGSWPLAFTLASGVGPGLMPRATSLIVAAFGLLFVVQGLTTLGERLAAWSLRGMVFLLGAVVVFAATVRPLGLAVAGPLAIVIASLADPQTRPREIIPFALLLTGASILLFKYALRQPIPLAPFYLGY